MVTPAVTPPGAFAGLLYPGWGASGTGDVAAPVTRVCSPAPNQTPGSQREVGPL